MNRIKLIALDMDGTLLNKDSVISEGNREAIEQAHERGVHVVLSTGRALRTAGDYADTFSFASYLVTVNGSEVWHPDRTLLERHPIASEHVQWMWELARQYGTWYWGVTRERVCHRDHFPENIKAHMWLKFGFDTKDDHSRYAIWTALEETGQFELSNSNATNIEVNAKGVSKASGLRAVCRELGITMGNVMAAGDSLNDMAMIQEAGLGIAMQNAQTPVKEAADWITGTNHEDGVAQAIQRWVLY